MGRSVRDREVPLSAPSWRSMGGSAPFLISPALAFAPPLVWSLGHGLGEVSGAGWMGFVVGTLLLPSASVLALGTGQAPEKWMELWFVGLV